MSYRSFYPVAFCIGSQKTTSIWNKVFVSLSQIFYKIVGRRLQLMYVMGDADDAQFNAVGSLLAEAGRYMMCFYHVVAKLVERARSIVRF